MSFEGNTWYTYLIYSLIVIIAFFGNALVLYIFITKCNYLKYPYNVFIFNLAFVDILTAIALIFSRFLYLPPLPNGEVSREIYCRVIWTAWIPFSFGYVSIYSCLALTIERWLSVVKPKLYHAMKTHHAVKGCLFVWIWGFAVNLVVLFRAEFDKTKQSCNWKRLSVANDKLPWLDFTLQSILPFVSMVILYCHILYRIRKLRKTNIVCDLHLKKITILVFVACTALVVGWLPSRITFLMSKFEIVDAGGVLHFCLIMLGFSNSCVNPFIYAVSNSQFRKEYREVFGKIGFRCFAPKSLPATREVNSYTNPSYTTTKMWLAF